MKRFRFALEGLLRVRRIAEDQKLQELRERQRALNALDQEVARIIQERNEQVRELSEIKEGRLDTDAIRRKQAYLNVLAMEAIRKQQRRGEFVGRVTDAKKKLQDVMREREVVEQLRERKHSEYLLAVQREESRELDEIGRMQYVHRTREAMSQNGMSS